MLKVFIFFLFSLTLFGAEIKPFKELKADDAVNDIVLFDGKVLAGTDGGSLILFDLNGSGSKTLLKLPKIKDFMGDMIDDKIFSVDHINGKYLILSDSGEGGFSNLILLENGKTTKLIGPDKRLAIIKAKFISDSKIFFVDLGSVAYLFDIKLKKILYSKQLSGSKFSDFALNVDKTKAVVAGESGVLRVVDVKSGKVLDEIRKLHLDNVFSVSFAKDWIASGSQDRRAGYYNIKSKTKGYFSGNFLVYATAISPDEKLFAYAMDSDNSISIYDIDTKAKKYTLKGQKSILTVMKFMDKNTLVSASHDDTIMVWKLK